MKNQYFGDINDYLKYALLRALSGGGELRTLVAWMLTPDDGSGDGRKLGYLSQPARYRPLDPELFDFLTTAAGHPDRGVSLIEVSGLLPDSRYHSEFLSDALPAREKYFRELAGLYPEADWVFFDPDNGFEIPSCSAGRRNSAKFLYGTELAYAYRSGLSVLLYQHFPREARDSFIPRLQERLAAETGAPEVIPLITSQVGFFLVPQEQHRAHFWKRIALLVQEAGSLIRIWTPGRATPAAPAERPLPQAPVVDLADGVIEDVDGFTAREVAGKQVLCPACRGYVFQRWPFGWDSHAHRCAGLSELGHEERKVAFKTQWRGLFR